MAVVDDVLAAVRARALPGVVAASGVDVHFHPDAIAPSGRTVLAELIRDGRWRTQFETGTSNGGLTAFAGGDRWRWESRLFEGGYDGADPAARPTYGALRTSDRPRGSAPRFGSAHLRLRPAVLPRTTICFPDSVFGPTALGTPDRAGAVLTAMRTIVLDDPLDRYVEAHVHGGVGIAADVDALVLDPSYRGTPIEADAAGWPGSIEWHGGFVLEPDVIPDLAGYRGAAVSDAAARVADGGPLTPFRLGLARSGLDPVVAKRVWHLLAASGDVGPTPRP